MVFCIIGVEHKEDDFKVYECKSFFSYMVAVDYAPTLRAGRSGLKTIEPINLRIRKLTPLECWRLMGFDDEDFYKAQNVGISNSQLYKQAGNSIVVNVLQAIFRNLFNNI